MTTAATAAMRPTAPARRNFPPAFFPVRRGLPTRARSPPASEAPDPGSAKLPVALLCGQRGTVGLCGVVCSLPEGRDRLRVDALDADELVPGGLAGGDADRAARDPQRLGEQLDHRRVRLAVDGRR